MTNSNKYTEDLDLTGTSSAKGATQNVVSYYTNTGADLIFDFVGLDFPTENVAFESTFQCGTSTWIGGVVGGSLTDTSTAGIVASTTVASTFDTDDLNIIYPNMLVNPGSSQIYASSSPCVLENGEVLFCTWTPHGATSSESFTLAELDILSLEVWLLIVTLDNNCCYTQFLS